MQLLSLANQAYLVAVNANDNDTDPTPGQLLPACIETAALLSMTSLSAPAKSLT